jgi:hypothetical protein
MHVLSGLQELIVELRVNEKDRYADVLRVVTANDHLLTDSPDAQLGNLEHVPHISPCCSSLKRQAVCITGNSPKIPTNRVFIINIHQPVDSFDAGVTRSAATGRNVECFCVWAAL